MLTVGYFSTSAGKYSAYQKVNFIKTPVAEAV